MKIVDVVHVLNVRVCPVVELCIVFYIIVKASSCWASPRIGWCLPLSFDAFNNFPCLGIDSSKRINSTILLLWVHIIISCTSRYPLLPRHSNLILYLLISWSMLHILLIQSRCHIHIMRVSHDDLVVHLMLAHIGRVLLSFSYSEGIKVISVVVGCYSSVHKLLLIGVYIHHHSIVLWRVNNAALTTLLGRMLSILLLLDVRYVLLGSLNCIFKCLWQDLSSYMHSWALRCWW